MYLNKVHSETPSLKSGYFKLHTSISKMFEYVIQEQVLVDYLLFSYCVVNYQIVSDCTDSLEMIMLVPRLFWI